MKSNYYRGENNLFLVIIGHFFFLFKFQNGCIEVILTITELEKTKLLFEGKTVFCKIRGTLKEWNLGIV